jgi:hypothetical protein
MDECVSGVTEPAVSAYLGATHPAGFAIPRRFLLWLTYGGWPPTTATRRRAPTWPIGNVLYGVAHAGTSVWAGGYYSTGTGGDHGVRRTLIERYTC